jgi:hypothetical protein
LCPVAAGPGPVRTMPVIVRDVVIQQVPVLLNCPRAVRVRGHAQHMDMADADLEHEEHLDAAQGDRAVDGEVGLERGSGLIDRPVSPGRSPHPACLSPGTGPPASRSGWPPTGISSRGRSCRRDSSQAVRCGIGRSSHHGCLGTRATVGVEIRIRARVRMPTRAGFCEPARFGLRAARSGQRARRH